MLVFLLFNIILLDHLVVVKCGKPSIVSNQRLPVTDDVNKSDLTSKARAICTIESHELVTFAKLPNSRVFPKKSELSPFPSTLSKIKIASSKLEHPISLDDVTSKMSLCQ